MRTLATLLAVASLGCAPPRSTTDYSFLEGCWEGRGELGEAMKGRWEHRSDGAWAVEFQSAGDPLSLTLAPDASGWRLCALPAANSGLTCWRVTTMKDLAGRSLAEVATQGDDGGAWIEWVADAEDASPGLTIFSALNWEGHTIFRGTRAACD